MYYGQTAQITLPISKGFKNPILLVRTTHSSSSDVYSVKKNGANVSRVMQMSYPGTNTYLYDIKSISAGDTINISVNSGPYNVLVLYER